ncbi:NAD(P)H:quinone oxidoreductase type IV [Frigidibacter albus]|uniref:NAD(P)H:quinone oxidoreductase type IV n=1 Tax=Frigidibacter albus TaxID=1465486 RepID=A0A6L8VJH5_9RHOB|nr:NAD(P)H:quinone oxidoreductase type IV [Frigidibacter albus]MZQ89459.1 NAD(P)H:quinone oxidoreductase type IV [Frigidibacter albus]NBE31365.1 NAD(P)H:quinone oxidoreductase type IV [Frigidibacter albus]GGH54253.1 trp repressor-binding protein WrbA [Frigidibacter albus]
MTQPKIAVIFYTTYGTNHAIALAAAEAAEAAGAEVRLRRVKETAPMSVVEGQAPWKAQLEKMADIPEVSPDDMEWAEGYFFSAPTRYGVVASQMRAFIDTLGGLWSKGKLADKPVTATTSAGNTHGGQETTLISLYTTFMHWGAILVPPGYTAQAVYDAGGNPYGYSAKAGEFDEVGKAAVAHQATRLVEFTKKLVG